MSTFAGPWCLHAIALYLNAAWQIAVYPHDIMGRTAVDQWRRWQLYFVCWTLWAAANRFAIVKRSGLVGA